MRSAVAFGFGDLVPRLLKRHSSDSWWRSFLFTVPHTLSGYLQSRRSCSFVLGILLCASLIILRLPCAFFLEILLVGCGLPGLIHLLSFFLYSIFLTFFVALYERVFQFYVQLFFVINIYI